MTSRNLFFKLMREDLKRRVWLPALIALGCFFLFPVSALFLAGEMKDAADAAAALKEYTSLMLSQLGFCAPLTVVGVCVAAPVCGMSSFSYLNSAKKVDFYHSLPVRREKLYLANYGNGILLFALPYALMLTLAVFVGAANGVDFGKLSSAALQGFALHLTYFLLLYAVSVLAAMLTGNLVVEFLGILVFWFYAPLLSMVVRGYFDCFFDSWYAVDDGFFELLGRRGSPFMEYIRRLSDYGDRKPVLAGAVCALALSLLFAALGCLLYRLRPSEAAGKAMAFSATKPVIRGLISILSGMGLGLVFWSMRNASGWAVFGTVCGTVIAHCVIEIIYHFDFKKLFSDKAQLAGCVAAAVAVFCVFRLDLTGYDSYIPAESEVESAGIQVSALDSWVTRGSVVRTEEGYYTWRDPVSGDEQLRAMACTDTATVREIAADAVRQLQERKERRYAGEEEYGTSAGDLWGGWSRITVCYHLKSGKDVWRSYSALLNGIIPQLDRLWANPGYLAARFPLMARSGDDAAAVSYREMEKETALSGLTAPERSELLTTYQKEFAALKLETMRTEFPVGLIRFASTETEAALSWWDAQGNKSEGFIADGYGYISRYDLENRDYYPVYPSFTQTVALLRQYGAEPGTALSAESVASVVIRSYDEAYPDGTVEVTVTDAGQVEELLGILKDTDRSYYDGVYGFEPNVEAEVYTGQKDVAGGTLRGMSFPRGRVPEFVRELIGEEASAGGA